MNIENSVEKLETLNIMAIARKEFSRDVTGQSTTSTPWKFDALV